MSFGFSDDCVCNIFNSVGLYITRFIRFIFR